MYALQGFTCKIEKYGHLCLLHFDHAISKIPDSSDIATTAGGTSFDKVIGYIPDVLVPLKEYRYVASIVKYGQPVADASFRISCDPSFDVNGTKYCICSHNFPTYDSAMRLTVTAIWFV